MACTQGVHAISQEGKQWEHASRGIRYLGGILLGGLVFYRYFLRTEGKPGQSLMRTVGDWMSRNPAFCYPDTSLQEAARIMVDRDCGEVPVVDVDRQVIGVITDRDITCRTVAHGLNPLQLSVRSCMSTPVETIHVRAGVRECVRKMEQFKIRRLPVVNDQGKLCGMISQADLARRFDRKEVGKLVEKVSESPLAA